VKYSTSTGGSMQIYEDLMNFLPTGKFVSRVHGTVDWWHSRVHDGPTGGVDNRRGGALPANSTRALQAPRLTSKYG
jgi:hypothetical protein